MKYTIMGFSQARLLALGLDTQDALTLDWFVTFQNSGRMQTMVIEGQIWYWVNYAGVLRDIPILGGSVKTISRRFDKLENAGVLDHVTLRKGGTFSCYRLNKKVYTSLVDDQPELAADELELFTENGVDTPRTNLSDPGTEMSEGETEVSDPVGQKCPTPSDKSVRPKDSLTRRTHLQEDSLRPSISPRTNFFEQFWKIYPKKKSKGDAEKAWRSLKPDEALVDRILMAVEIQKTSADWVKDGGQFIPYPATWLRARKWEDEINPPGPERGDEPRKLGDREEWRR